MKLILLAAMIVLTMALSGCTGQKAAELYETAQFEEKQNNPEHAAELYEEILRKYPDSEFAQKARARLTEIRGGER
jgi:outer membrane protein assembly factor BamD (BamD/ComL family)